MTEGVNAIQDLVGSTALVTGATSLASPRAAFITGAILPIDAGQTTI